MPNMIMEPMSGRMNILPDIQIAFPCRRGNLYNIRCPVKWKVKDIEEAKRHIHSTRIFHRYTLISQFMGLMELQAIWKLGLGPSDVQSIEDSFEMLVMVKSQVDPSNFFRTKQSIPPFGSVRYQESIGYLVPSALKNFSCDVMLKKNTKKQIQK